MTKRIVLLAVFVLAAGHAFAQRTPPPTPGTPKLLPPAAPAVPAPPPPPKGQPINVRVELTISEAGAGAPPVKRTVVAVVADGYSGSVRGQGRTMAPPPGPGAPPDVTNAPLNLDARPEILSNGKIRLTCAIQYASNQRQGQDRTVNTEIRQNLVLNLENGKPLVISEAADPIVADRHVTVEVTATILK